MPSDHEGRKSAAGCRSKGGPCSPRSRREGERGPTRSELNANNRGGLPASPFYFPTVQHADAGWRVPKPTNGITTNEASHRIHSRINSTAGKSGLGLEAQQT